jgi:polysaccharide export outer membrane protein
LPTGKDIPSMLKAFLLATAAVFLSGCAASSRNESGVSASITSDSLQEQQVTAAVVPASLVPDRRPSGDKVKKIHPSTPRAAEAAAEISAVTTAGSAAYKIGPQDVLEVTVFKVGELSKTAQVSEAGTISFPLVGDLRAAGRTPREVEKELAARLGAKYLQNPQVTVYVKEFNSQRVTVEGAVKRPGVFPLQGSLSLLQAIALAQGLEGVSDNTVLVFRETNGTRSAARFDISDIRSGTTDDPQLQAGDVVVAGTSTIKEGLGNILKLVPLASFAVL